MSGARLCACIPVYRILFGCVVCDRRGTHGAVRLRLSLPVAIFRVAAACFVNRKQWYRRCTGDRACSRFLSCTFWRCFGGMVAWPAAGCFLASSGDCAWAPAQAYGSWLLVGCLLRAPWPCQCAQGAVGTWVCAEPAGYIALTVRPTQESCTDSAFVWCCQAWAPSSHAVHRATWPKLRAALAGRCCGASCASWILRHTVCVMQPGACVAGTMPWVWSNGSTW